MAERGDFAAAFVWILVGQSVSELGLYSSVAFFSAKAGRRRPLGLLLPTSLVALQSVLAACIALLVLARFVDVRNEALFVAAAILPVVACAGVPLYALYGTSIAKWNWARFVQAVSYLVALAILTLFGAQSASGVVLLYGACSVVGALGAVWFLWRIDGVVIRGQMSAARLYRYGLPSLGFTLPAMLSRRVDQLFLSIFAAPAQLGVYAVASGWVGSIAPALAAVGNVALPRLARSSNPDEQRVLALAALRRTMVVAGCGVATTAVTAPVVVPLLFGEEYEKAGYLCVLIAPAAWAAAVRQACGDVMRGVGSPGVAARYESIGFLGTAPVLGLGFAVGGVPGTALSYSVGTVLLALVFVGGARAAVGVARRHDGSAS